MLLFSPQENDSTFDLPDDISISYQKDGSLADIKDDMLDPNEDRSSLMALFSFDEAPVFDLNGINGDSFMTAKFNLVK